MWISGSEEGFVELSDVFLQVVLSLVVDPLLEIVEVEDVRVADVSGCQPLGEEGEVVAYFFAVEDSVDHVAAEESEFDFVAGVRVYLLVFMDGLEDVGGGGPVGELEFFEGVFCDIWFVSFLKIFDGHFSEYLCNFAVDIFEGEMCFHVFFLQMGEVLFVLWCFGAFFPVVFIDVSVGQRFWQLLSAQTSEEGIGVEDFHFEEIILGCQSFGIGEV